MPPAPARTAAGRAVQIGRHHQGGRITSRGPATRCFWRVLGRRGRLARMEGAKYDPSLLRPLPPAVTLRRIDAAIQAARAAARGERRRADVRELLVAELGTRGLMMSPPLVDLMVDVVVAGPMRRLAFQAKLGGFAVRFLSAAVRHQTLPRWDARPTRLVYSGLPFRPVDVILDQGAVALGRRRCRHL